MRTCVDTHVVEGGLEVGDVGLHLHLEHLRGSRSSGKSIAIQCEEQRKWVAGSKHAAHPKALKKFTHHG